jgi:hypothetical protein
MNVRKTLVRVLALALLAAPAAVVASGESAQAVTMATHGTTVTLDPITSTTTYGGDVYVTGSVKDATTGDSVYDGTVTLMALPYGASAWQPIATDTAGGYVSFDVKPGISTQYQLVYGGGDNGYDTTWTGNHSSSVLAPVARKLTIKHKGLKMWGKVTPAAKKLKLVFKIKKGHKYKKWFTVKTNKKGKWTKHIHGKVGTHFVVVLPGSGGYAGAANAYTIIGF